MTDSNLVSIKIDGAFSEEFCKQCNEVLKPIFEMVKNDHCSELNLSGYRGFKIVNDLPVGVLGEVKRIDSDNTCVKISQEILLELLNVKDEEEKRSCVRTIVHVIHHELCHIAVGNNIKDILETRLKNMAAMELANEHQLQFETIRDVALALSTEYAVKLFDEYMACRISRGTAGRELVNSKVDNIKNMFESHFNLPISTDSFRDSAYAVTQLLGYTLDRKDGLYLELLQSIENNVNRRYLTSFETIFRELEDKYPNVECGDFATASKCVMQFYDLFVGGE